MKLTEREILLIDNTGFNQLFEQSIKDFENYRICYESLEVERLALTGKRLYNSYENFKSCRSKYLKRKLSLTTIKDINTN